LSARKEHFRSQLLFICVAQIGICLCLAAVLLNVLPVAYIFGAVSFISIIAFLFRTFFWHVQDLPLNLDERIFEGHAETWAIFTLLPPIYFLTPFPELLWGVKSDTTTIAYMAIAFTSLCVVFELLLFNRIVDFFSEERIP